MKKYVQSVVQHGLTALGAVLVAAGIVDNDTVAQFVTVNTAIITGAVMYAVGQLWAVFTKQEINMGCGKKKGKGKQEITRWDVIVETRVRTL